MRYGKNKSGREFEAVSEDGDVCIGFDSAEEAAAAARALPWYCGECFVRRDIETVERSHRETQELRRKNQWWLDAA